MHCLASIERFRVRAWPTVWLVVCSILLAVTEPSTSAPETAEAGFDIRNARVELVEGVYLLDADISFVFSEEALEAIENGVPVTIVLEMRNLNSGETRVFGSFDELLEGLGRIRDFPLLDEHLLGEEGDYYLRFRALLDIESLPSPMRPWAYLSGLWRLESDWYEWSLER